MNLIDRIKQILISPKTEWMAIDNDNENHIAVLTKHVLLLAIIPAVTAFIGYGIIGYSVFGFHIASYSHGIKQAIIQYVTMVGGVYAIALILHFLANTFGTQKNFDKAFSLAAYACTPAFLAGVFHIHHSISFLAGLVSVYSFFLLFMGIKPMMKTPDNKRVPYFIVTLAVLAGVATTIVLTFVLGAFIFGSTRGFYRFF